MTWKRNMAGEMVWVDDSPPAPPPAVREGEPATLHDAIGEHYANPKIRADGDRRELERRAHGFRPNPEMERSIVARDRVGHEAWLRAGNGDDGGLGFYEDARAAAIALGTFTPPKAGES